MLDGIEFLLGYHGRMPANVPGPASSWVFIRAMVESVDEDVVNRVSPEGVPERSSVSPGGIGNLSDFGRCVLPGKHQIPTPPDYLEALRVFGDDVPSLLVHSILISRWCGTWKPTRFRLCAESSLHSFAQVIDILLSHAELQIHPHDIVLGLAVCLERGNDLHLMLLHRPNDGTTIDGITRQTIRLPAEDPVRFAGVKASHHLVEHGSSRCFG